MRVGEGSLKCYCRVLQSRGLAVDAKHPLVALIIIGQAAGETVDPQAERALALALRADRLLTSSTGGATEQRALAQRTDWGAWCAFCLAWAPQ